MAERMKCPNCGNNDALGCGYGVKSETDCGTEFDCEFWWDDTLFETPICDYCPLLWCKECRDTFFVDAVAMLEKWENRKKEIADANKREE